jgi:hypothetical protein
MQADGSERLERARFLIEVALVAFLFAGLFLSFGIGAADNGDYTRAMGWLTSGPATIEPNWPVRGSDAFRRRFGTFWIPYWKLDWPLDPGVLSSTIVLWFPGAVLNWLFYSRKILYLPFLSIVPRLCLTLLYVAVLRWSGWRTSGRAARWVATIGVGVPLALLFMAVDYVYYFSSFYRDTGTIVFLLAFLVSLVMLDANRHERTALLLSALSLTLLATAKITNVYWPVVAFPFLLLSRGGRRHVAAVTGVFLLSGTLALAVFSRAELPQVRDYQAYSSLYTGLLAFSSRPAEHLTRLGLQETTDFVGKVCYLPETSQWLDSHPKRLSIHMTFDVLLHEPTAFLRELSFAARAMQDTAPRVGVRAEGDPTPPTRRSFQQLWCLLKTRTFPRGGALFAALGVFAAVFVLGLRASMPLRQLSLVGLFATVGILVEMSVTLLGGGTPDMARHLVIANFLFDLAVIAFCTTCVLRVVRLAAPARGPALDTPDTVAPASTAAKTSV